MSWQLLHSFAHRSIKTPAKLFENVQLLLITCTVRDFYDDLLLSGVFLLPMVEKRSSIVHIQVCFPTETIQSFQLVIMWFRFLSEQLADLATHYLTTRMTYCAGGHDHSEWSG